MTEAEALLAPSTTPIFQIDRFKDKAVGMNTASLLSGLTQREYQEVISFARLRSFVRNECLFAQGQPIDRLMLIQSGSVKVTQTSYHGEEVILSINGFGETIGAPVKRQNLQHTCSAQALEDCKAFVWQFERFQALAARYPRLVANVGGILGERLQELEQRFTEVATERADCRLALALSRLARSVGEAHHRGIRISLSGEELAQITAATLYTVSRTLAQWDRSGLIDRSRQSIIVHDLSQFEAVAIERGKGRIKRNKEAVNGQN